MTFFLAKAAVFAAMAGVALANYWYTFGLWPKSWLSFVVCIAASITLMGVNLAIGAEGKSQR